MAKNDIDGVETVNLINVPVNYSNISAFGNIPCCTLCWAHTVIWLQPILNYLTNMQYEGRISCVSLPLRQPQTVAKAMVVVDLILRGIQCFVSSGLQVRCRDLRILLCWLRFLTLHSSQQSGRQHISGVRVRKKGAIFKLKFQNWLMLSSR